MASLEKLAASVKLGRRHTAGSRRTVQQHARRKHEKLPAPHALQQRTPGRGEAQASSQRSPQCAAQALGRSLQRQRALTTGLFQGDVVKRGETCAKSGLGSDDPALVLCATGRCAFRLSRRLRRDGRAARLTRLLASPATSTAPSPPRTLGAGDTACGSGERSVSGSRARLAGRPVGGGVSLSMCEGGVRARRVRSGFGSRRPRRATRVGGLLTERVGRPVELSGERWAPEQLQANFRGSGSDVPIACNFPAVNTWIDIAEIENWPPAASQYVQSFANV